MKKGQEPGQLDKEAVGRITCRILQEEEPGGMLVKKLWRLAGMLICLLCLTGGLCSAFLSGFGIRYLVPVFWMFLIVSVLFWIGFSRLPLEGVYRLLAILGTLIGVSLLLLLLQKDVIAGYMSAVNGVRSRLNEAYDGTLAMYQASSSAMQMTVFFGFILFLLTGLLSAAQCRRCQSGGSKGSGQCPSSKADDRADEKQCQCLAAFAGCSAVAVGVCAGAAPDQYPAPGTGGRDEDTKRCAAGSLAAASGGFRREAEAFR